MDNVPFHKKKEIGAILGKHGHAFLPLPPYSPDPNPIEKNFGALKKRQKAEKSENFSLQRSRFFPTFRGLFSKRGPVAQLGERLHGMQEAVGSIPIGSTILPPF